LIQVNLAVQSGREGPENRQVLENQSGQVDREHLYLQYHQPDLNFPDFLFVPAVHCHLKHKVSNTVITISKQLHL